jgi:micrococcal nuclease
MDSNLNIIIAALAMACLAVAPAAAAKMFRGPVEATVVEIIDGDTFLADAQVWPGHSVRVNIRIRGIDAPEMKARCEAERTAALRARDALALLVADKPVSISNIGGAKYYGRVLADVATPDGLAIGPILLGENLVRPYAGGKRAGWCG